MSLRIIKAGLLDTIQDMGRYGYQQLGINPTGAMDKLAAAIANILVGNNAGEAVIEMHFPAPVILFEKPALIALAGADFNATIDGVPVSVNQPVLINKSCLLQFHSAKKNCRCYLAVKGGLQINKWLNSCSTNLKAEAGGFFGNKLVKDDVIALREEFSYPISAACKIFPWKANEEIDESQPDEIFVLPGSEWHWLEEPAKQKFLKNIFYISSNSDRMGYRLASEPLLAQNKSELLSSAVCFGTIQLLPDGQLIILMADHQTMGGYPRIGNVITAHLHRLAQKKTGDQLHFKMTSHDIAENLLLKQQLHLQQLQIACKLKLEQFIYENY